MPHTDIYTRPDPGTGVPDVRWTDLPDDQVLTCAAEHLAARNGTGPFADIQHPDDSRDTVFNADTVTHKRAKADVYNRDRVPAKWLPLLWALPQAFTWAGALDEGAVMVGAIISGLLTACTGTHMIANHKALKRIRADRDVVIAAGDLRNKVHRALLNYLHREIVSATNVLEEAAGTPSRDRVFTALMDDLFVAAALMRKLDEVDSTVSFADEYGGDADMLAATKRGQLAAHTAIGKVLKSVALTAHDIRANAAVEVATAKMVALTGTVEELLATEVSDYRLAGPLWRQALAS